MIILTITIYWLNNNMGFVKQMASGSIPCNLYIDLSKAFNTFSFDILIYKLRYYGFSAIELKLLLSYVQN